MVRKKRKQVENLSLMSARWSSILRLKDVQLAWMSDVVESRPVKPRTRVNQTYLIFKTMEVLAYPALLQQELVIKSLLSSCLIPNHLMKLTRHRPSLSSKFSDRRS